MSSMHSLGVSCTPSSIYVFSITFKSILVTILTQNLSIQRCSCPAPLEPSSVGDVSHQIQTKRIVHVLFKPTMFASTLSSSRSSAQQAGIAPTHWRGKLGAYAEAGFRAARSRVTRVIVGCIRYCSVMTLTGTCTVPVLFSKFMMYDSTPSNKLRVRAKYRISGHDQELVERTC